MKILQRYVFASFLSSFFLAFLVLTFVLSVGLLVKATQLVVDDMPIAVVARFLAVGIPESFAFTIPLASLVSSLLVFGRLSSDGEIGAMKACGVNLWSIMFPLVVFGIAMSAFGVYINNCVTPASHLMRRSLQSDVKSNGLLLLEPGTEQNLLGKTIWFESKDKDGTLLNVHIREAFTKVVTNESTLVVSTNSIPRTIQAERAMAVQSGDDLRLDLYNVRVDPFSENFPGAATADRLTHIIQNAMKTRSYKAKVEDYSLPRLWDEVSDNIPGKIEDMVDSAMVTREKLTEQLDDLANTDGYDVSNLRSAVYDKHTHVLYEASGKIGADIKVLKEFQDNQPIVGSDIVENGVLSTNAMAITAPADMAVDANSIPDALSAKYARLEKLTEVRNRFEHLAKVSDNLTRYRKELRKHTFELHRRFAMASAAICFLMLGMPLGIRARRRESTIGIAISLGIALLYYLFVVAGEEFTKSIGGPVHLIVWIPAIVCLVVSAWLTARNS